MKTKKTIRRTRIRRAIRAKIVGTANRPRLSVFKSNRGIYAQLIDDVTGRTLAESHSGIDANLTQTIANQVGQELAKKAKELQPKAITQVVFDRGGWKYHGRIQALAEGARKGGLLF